jgi:hypothetical protein
MVSNFQAAHGLKRTGLFSAREALVLARFCGNVPLIRHWGKTGTARSVERYREELERLAREADKLGNVERAALLRMSAARERGQMGVRGAVPSTEPTPTKTLDGEIVVLEVAPHRDRLGMVS